MEVGESTRGTRPLALGAVAVASVIGLQALGLPRPVTGLAVNAVYILLYLRAGVAPALALALVTPLGALAAGHLPAALVALVPAITCGNMVLVLVYRALHHHTGVLRLVAPAAAKAATIAAGGLAIVSLLGGLEATGGGFWFVLAIQAATAAGGIVCGETLSARLPAGPRRAPLFDGPPSGTLEATVTGGRREDSRESTSTGCGSGSDGGSLSLRL